MSDQPTLIMSEIQSPTQILSTQDLTIVKSYPGAIIALGSSPQIYYREYVASAAIGGQRVVSLRNNQLQLAANVNALDADLVVGVTLAASSIGALCRAYNNYSIIDIGFAFTPGLPVFLTTNGSMSQSPPTTGLFLLQIGVALQPTELWVEIGSPIIFS